MTAAFCLPETMPEVDSYPALSEPGPRRFDWLAAGVTMLVVLLHGVALASFLVASHAPANMQRPVLQGALVQPRAALQPEPVAEQVSLPEPKPSEPAPQRAPVPEPLPVTADGEWSHQPEPVPEPQKPEPLLQEQTELAPEPAVKPQESAPPASAPVTAPRADASHLNNPAPAYPMLSRRLREEGTVLLQLLIEADGRISELEVLQSSGFPRLDQAALEAVQKWRFEPARQGDTAIAYRYQQPITFQLQ